MEDSFVDRVVDRLGDLRGLGCRSMFGGHGLFRGRTLFGIVSAGRLYLKTGDATALEYMRRGMGPFRPGDREGLGTYFEVPEDVLRDGRQLCEWAEAAADEADAGCCDGPRAADMAGALTRLVQPDPVRSVHGVAARRA